MSSDLRLITIPISHYCEKARWALDWAGLRYTEDAHLQVFHYLPVRRAGGKRTVPVLCHPGGALYESTDILRFADARCSEERKLFPKDPEERAEVERLAARFDQGLGPAGRLWLYHHLLTGAPELAPKYGCTGVPAWQRKLLPLAYPLVRLFLQRLLLTSPSSAEQAYELCQQIFDEVAARLSSGQPYLVGTRFSAADLTFAALCAPLLMTPGYGVPLPRIEELPADFARCVAAFRAHPAGRFALDLYVRHRRAHGATQASGFEACSAPCR
jgi:glutathione S-transferase